MLRAVTQYRHTLLRAQHCDSTQRMRATVCVYIMCYSTQYCESTLWQRRTSLWHRRTTLWHRRTSLHRCTSLWHRRTIVGHRRTTVWHWRATLRHRLFVTHTLKEVQCCSAPRCESVSHAVWVAKNLCHKDTQCCSAPLCESVSQRDSVSLCTSVSQRVCVTKRLSVALHLCVNMYPKGSMSQRNSVLLCTSVWVCVSQSSFATDSLWHRLWGLFCKRAL